MKRRRSHLFWRIYLHGLVLLILVTMAVVLTGKLVKPTLFDYVYMSHYAALRVGQVRSDSSKLSQELHRAGDDLGLQLSLWSWDGTLLASNHQPPLPSPAPPELTCSCPTPSAPSSSPALLSYFL